LSRFAPVQRLLPAFAAASLLAVGVGAVVCALSGVPAGLWGRNLVAWVAGGLAAAALARWAGLNTLRAVAVLTPAAVAAALLGEGQLGVHRWLDLGPLSMNIAMLLLPTFVVALAVLAPRAARWWIPALLSLAALVLQPDASQATALATAVCAVAFGARTPVSWGVALLAVALAALAWTRADPLEPVAEVEGVIGLAASLSPVLAVLCVLALAAVAATPALLTRASPQPAVRTAGRALTALFLAWSVAPALGAFPVPLVGVGLSPILGAWLGLGLLGAANRPQAVAIHPDPGEGNFG
jgi:hypothetical protein